jgi:MFS family permease
MREPMSTRTSWAPGQRLLTSGLVFLVTASAFEGLAVPTVLPSALDEVGGLALYGWAFSGFWLTNLVGITLAGIETDRRGPLRPFIAGIALSAAGLLIAAVAPDMAWIVVGRAVQGVGAGAIGALVYVAIARGYDPSAQPRMIAVISSAWVLPGLIGPLIAGVVAEQAGWRWVFGGLAPLLPLAALAMFGPMARLPSQVAPAAGERPARGRDAVQLALGAGAVLTAASLGELWQVGLLGVAGVLLARGALLRLLPPGTMTARTGPGAATAALALVSISFFGAEAFVPLAVSSVRGAGPLVGGLALTTAAVTWAAGSWVQARLAARGVRRSLVAAGLLLVLVGIGVETPVPISGAPVWLAAAGWAVAGLGMGLAYSTTTLLIIETAAAGAEGAASASVQLANTLGIAVGTGLAGAIVALVATGPGLAPGIAIANLVMLALGANGLLAVRGLPSGERGASANPPLAGEHGPGL